MKDSDVDAVEWVQLDRFGMVAGSAFHGTGTALATHLQQLVPEGSVAVSSQARVYVRLLVDTVTCPLVTLTTPWGAQRWIPKPPRRRPS